MKPKILISNLVYGEPYTAIFLNFHLKSLLENCNPSPFAKDSIYIIYTDGRNIETIKASENFKLLATNFKCIFAQIDKNLVYEQRYSNQTIQLQHSLKIAIEQSALMHMSTADVYYGQEFWVKCLNSMESHNVQAVLGSFIRSTYETVGPKLLTESLSNDDLFDVAFDNLHPLYSACNWDAPMFTKIPYNLIWTAADQMVVRSFSLIPFLFTPIAELAKEGGCIDLSVQRHFSRLYIEQDWQQLPSIELGMLKAFYPPFGRSRSSIEGLVSFARRSIPFPNRSNIKNYCLAKRSDAPKNLDLLNRSSLVADEFLCALRSQPD